MFCRFCKFSVLVTALRNAGELMLSRIFIIFKERTMNLIEHARRCRVLLVLLCLGIFSASCTSTLPAKESRDVVAATPEPAPASTAPAPVSIAPAKAIPVEEMVATVNGKPITIWEFNARYAATMRERYYHGRPPEGQEEAVRKEVLDLLIENALLVEEAGKRGIKPDEAKFAEAAAKAEARYGAMPEWKRDREEALSMIKEQVEDKSLIEQASQALREVPPPVPDEVRAYYGQHPESFTEPEQLRLSVILLKVDPGVPADVGKAREEAQNLYLRLKDGADFAELARQNSGDGSAEKGGDMGYMHGGMLPEQIQVMIDKLQVGMVSEPVRVLEGVALYRVDERVPPILREFKEVEARAQNLLVREQQDLAWKEATKRLRENARIEILVSMSDGSTKPIADSSIKQDGGTAGEPPIAPASSDAQNEVAKQKIEKKKSSKKKISKKKKINDKKL